LPDGATINNKDAFLYGGAITLETEIFVTDWLVLLANIRERTLAGSSVGLFNTQLGLGLRLIFSLLRRRNAEDFPVSSRKMRQVFKPDLKTDVRHFFVAIA
jgi:hypothetical protein